MNIVVVGNADDAKKFRDNWDGPVVAVDRPEHVEAFQEAGVLPNGEKYLLGFRRSEWEWRDRGAMMLGDENCDYIEWPKDGIQDCDDIWEVADKVKPMWVDEVCLMSDIPDEPTQEGFKTGFKVLDDHGFRVVRPAFFPVIGPYASGKSILLRQMAVNFYRLHGWRTMITAFEEKVRPRYVRDFRRLLIESNSQVRYSMQTPEDRYTPEQLRQADLDMDNAFRFLRRKRGTTLDANRLLDRIEYGVRRYGCEVVIIDPVNEIDHRVPRGMSKTDYMGDFIMSLKQLADDYRLLMIVAAHPPKDRNKTRGNGIYTLNDGADTSHYGNKADIGWAVWRPNLSDGPTYLNIDKTKDSEVMGKQALAKLSFDETLGRFHVVGIGHDVTAEILDSE